MSDYLVQQIRHKPNIEVRLGAEVVGAEGDDFMERLAIRDRTSNPVETIPAKLLFVLIGATPHTDWLAGTVQRDAKGFIAAGRCRFGRLAHWPSSDELRNERTGNIRRRRCPPRVHEARRLGSRRREGAVPNVHQDIVDAQETASG